jgi:hypothetical protein
MKKKLLVKLILIALMLLPLCIMAERDAAAQWSQMTFSAGTGGLLYGVWGTSATNVYAVGQTGQIIHYDGDGDDDGVSDTRWDAPMVTPAAFDLYAIWGAGASNIYAVGQGGTVLNFGGANWTDLSVVVPGGADIYGVWGTSSSDVFITDVTGIVCHGVGPAWVLQWTLAGNAFRGIWGSASDDVFTVDVTAGRIYHFNGAAWDITPMGTAAFGLTNIWGSSASDVYAIGLNGTVVHYDGSNWSPVTGISPGSIQLTGIWGSSASDIFIVGLGGTILHYDGTAWSDMASGTLENLWSVWGTGAGEVFAVGGTSVPIALRYEAPAPTTTTTAAITTTSTVITTTTTVGICPSEAIYGEDFETTELLRYVRDSILSATPEGREIIKLYYELSPVIVKAMQEDEGLKQEVKEMIDGVLLITE